MQSVDQRMEWAGELKRVGYLISGFLSGSLTESEHEELDDWVNADAANMQLFEDLTDTPVEEAYLRWQREHATKRAPIHIPLLKDEFEEKESHLWKYAAAALLVVVAGIIYYFASGPTLPAALTRTEQATDTGDYYRAIIRMPNGELFEANGDADTTIGGLEISKGMLVQTATLPMPGEYELIVPRKHMYRVQLADGTRVTLNAGSSLRFPGSADADIRRLSVQGEVLIDVEEDAARPFVVTSRQGQVTALGTQFLINDFDQEIILTNGSIRVEKDQQQVTLKPGQQLRTSDWLVAAIDPGIVTAWADNQFAYRDAPISKIMDDVARWYDMRVSFAQPIMDSFNCTINRNTSIEKFLELLETTGTVRFTIRGKEITVSR